MSLDHAQELHALKKKHFLSEVTTKTVSAVSPTIPSKLEKATQTGTVQQPRTFTLLNVAKCTSPLNMKQWYIFMLSAQLTSDMVRDR